MIGSAEIRIFLNFFQLIIFIINSFLIKNKLQNNFN